RLFVRVVILDGIFHRDDVLVEVLVDVVDHRRERGGLAGAGRAGDQEDSTGAAADLAGHFWQADLFEGQNFVWNLTKHHRAATLLLEDGDAETSLGSIGKTKVA